MVAKCNPWIYLQTDWWSGLLSLSQWQEKLAAWYPQACISCEMEMPAIGILIPHIEKEQKQLN